MEESFLIHEKRIKKNLDFTFAETPKVQSCTGYKLNLLCLVNNRPEDVLTILRKETCCQGWACCPSSCCRLMTKVVDSNDTVIGFVSNL